MVINLSLLHYYTMQPNKNISQKKIYYTHLFSILTEVGIKDALKGFANIGYMCAGTIIWMIRMHLTEAAYVIAVECVEHSWNVTAYDSDGDPSVVQRHPSAAIFFRSVAAEQVIAHRTQHAHLSRRHEVFRYRWFCSPYLQRDICKV